VILVDAPMSFAYNVPNSNIQISAHALTLRVVHLADVLLHERTEPQRVAQLVARIQADRWLQNPPIVAPHADQYILLDGATRVTALKQLGYRDVVTQIVDYGQPGLTLETWNHLLTGLALDDFLKTVRQLNGVTLAPTTRAAAAQALERRESVGTLILAKGRVLALRLTAADSLATQVEVLNGVVAAYEGRSQLQRIVPAEVAELMRGKLAWDAVMVFPRYRPEDIRALAFDGHKLPAGITRHIIPGRAMRINIPLALLQSADSLEWKNARLADWLRAQMRERRVRYYHEPVFLFGE
jgi:hypothetical protein